MARKKLASTPKVFLIALLLIAVLGFGLSIVPNKFVEGHNRNFDNYATTPSYQNKPSDTMTKKQLALKEAFENATLLMRNNHYHQSLPFWHQVLKIDSKLPEAHVNLGFVMLELNRLNEAKKSFETALRYRPQQANGYFGLAEIYDRQNMHPEAIGAMRTFLHLSSNEAYKTKARAAIWEWQEKLKENQ